MAGENHNRAGYWRVIADAIAPEETGNASVVGYAYRVAQALDPANATGFNRTYIGSLARIAKAVDPDNTSGANATEAGFLSRIAEVADSANTAGYALTRIGYLARYAANPGGGPAPAPTAPVLTMTDDTVNPPEFSFTTGDAAVGEDTLRLIHADNALFTGATTEDHLFVSDDVLEGTIVFPIFDAGFDGGDTIYWKMAIVRGGVVIATSNTLSALIVEAVAGTEYRSGAAGNGGFAGSYNFATVGYYAGKNIIAIGTRYSVAPTAVSLGGDAATKVAEVSTGGQKALSFWEVAKGADGSGTLAITCATIDSIGYALWSTGAGATFVAAQSLAYNYHPDPSQTPAITLPTDGDIFVFASSESFGATISPAGDTTEDAEFADTGVWKFFAGRHTATGQPGITGVNYAGSTMLAVSYQP